MSIIFENFTSFFETCCPIPLFYEKLRDTYGELAVGCVRVIYSILSKQCTSNLFF
jgi:hypothetical protein